MSSFANINGPVTYLLYDLNGVDIHLILEFKKGFGKHHLVCFKIP